MMSDEPDGPKKDRRAVYWIAALFVGVGLVMLGLVAASDQGLRLYGAGGMLAFAAFTSGSVFGLLFGIPRAAQAQAEERSGGDRTLSSLGKVLAANNNLIEISDWLTKILVGATLTQITKLPTALSEFGSRYGGQLGGEAVAVFLLVGFSASGFLSGYLFTRVVLQHVLHRADRVPDDAKDKTSPTAAIDERDPNPPSIKETAVIRQEREKAETHPEQSETLEASPDRDEKAAASPDRGKKADPLQDREGATVGPEQDRGGEP